MPTFPLGAQPGNDKKGAKLLSENANFENNSKNYDFTELWLECEMLRGRIDTLLRPIDPLYKRFYPGRDLKSPVTSPIISPPFENFGGSNIGVYMP